MSINHVMLDLNVTIEFDTIEARQEDGRIDVLFKLKGETQYTHTVPAKLTTGQVLSIGGIKGVLDGRLV